MTEEPCRSCDWLLSLGRNTALIDRQSITLKPPAIFSTVHGGGKLFATELAPFGEPLRCVLLDQAFTPSGNAHASSLE